MLQFSGLLHGLQAHHCLGSCSKLVLPTSFEHVLGIIQNPTSPSNGSLQSRRIAYPGGEWVLLQPKYATSSRPLWSNGVNDHSICTQQETSFQLTALWMGVRTRNSHLWDGVQNPTSPHVHHRIITSFGHVREWGSFNPRYLRPY